MATSVNNVFVTVDEDMVTLNDPDEVGSFSPHNSALSAVVASIAGADQTADFTATQIAAQDNVFTLGADTKNLKFAQDSSGAPFPTSGSGVDSGLTTADGIHIYLFQSSSEDVIYGAIGNNSTAKAAFVLVLDEQLTGTDVTNAKLWIIQYAALRHDGQNVTEGDLLDLQDKVFVASTATTTAVFSDFSDVPAGSPIFAMIADDTNQNPVDFLVTGYVADNPNTVPNESLTPKAINISNQSSFKGSLSSGGSQNLTPGSGLRFDTVLNGDNTYTQSEGNSDTNIDFDNHVPVVQAGFTVVQNQGGRPTDLNVQAWNSLSPTADGHAFMTALGNQQAVGVDRVRVTVIDTAGHVTQTITDTTTTNAFVTFNGDGSVTVKNTQLDWTVEIFQDATFNRFTVTNVDAEKNAYVDLGRMTFTSSTTTNDVDEVGSHIQFDDSGPSISATGALDALTVDDSGLSGGTDPAADTSDSANVALAFTSAYGSDGPGSISYAMKVVAGDDSGLDDVATGDNILLRVNGSGVVEGYLSAHTSDVAFTVGVDSSGEVSLTLLRAIKHDPGGVDESKSIAASKVQVQATITDQEGAATGDSKTATLDIGDKLNFKDDEPSIDRNATAVGALTVDDDVLGASGAATASGSALFAAVAGADGDDVSYALATPGGGSGVYDCASDQEVQLKLSGGQIVGYVLVNAVEKDVFTVGVDSDSGQVTLTLLHAIRHLDGSLQPTDDPMVLTGTGLINLVATITDKDGDTDSATADLTPALSFEDAQPTISTPAGINLKLADGQTKTELFTTDFNNDEPGTVKIESFASQGNYLAVQSSDTRIDFYDDKGTPGTSDDTLVYHVQVSSTGYTVTVDDAPDGGIIPLNFNAIKAGGPQEVLTVPLMDNSDSIVFDGFINGQQVAGDADYLNPDSLGFGIKNNQASQINPGESFSFKSLSGTELESLEFDIQGVGGIKTVRANWSLWDDNGTPSNFNDDILVDSGTHNFTNLPSGNNVVHVAVLDDGGASTSTQSGLPSPENTSPGDTFDYGIVSFVFPANSKGVVSDNQGVRVLDFATTLTTHIDPDQLTMTLVAEDCDGDTALTNLITVNVDPTFV